MQLINWSVIAATTCAAAGAGSVLVFAVHCGLDLVVYCYGGAAVTLAGFLGLSSGAWPRPIASIDRVEGAAVLSIAANVGGGLLIPGTWQEMFPSSPVWVTTEVSVLCAGLLLWLALSSLAGELNISVAILIVLWMQYWVVAVPLGIHPTMRGTRIYDALFVVWIAGLGALTGWRLSESATIAQRSAKSEWRRTLAAVIYVTVAWLTSLGAIWSICQVPV